MSRRGHGAGAAGIRRRSGAGQTRREEALALGAAVLWAAGAALARRGGLWRGLAPGALAAGALALGGGRGVRRLLRPRSARVLLGVVGGAAMVAATEALYPVVARAAPATVAEAEQLYAAFGALPRARAAALLAPIILAEELVWRGLVQGALARRHGAPRGAALAALAYAAAHTPVGSPLLAAVALGCGAVWSALGALGGDLGAPLAAHAVWDASVLLARPLSPAAHAHRRPRPGGPGELAPPPVSRNTAAGSRR